jgi:hypothetical protein
VKALLASSAADTCLTEAFSVMWPHAPHRVLRSAVAAAGALTEDVIGEDRGVEQVLPIPRFSVIPPTRSTTGHIEAMALYAGKSVTNVTSVRPAAAIVSELVDGAERLLREAADR